MTGIKHKCPRDNDNVVFYSNLWRSWALKIIPANYDAALIAGVNLPVLTITIKYCPYCGDGFK